MQIKRRFVCLDIANVSMPIDYYIEGDKLSFWHISDEVDLTEEEVAMVEKYILMLPSGLLEKILIKDYLENQGDIECHLSH